VGGGERIFSTMWNRFDETFSLVVKYDSIKIVLTIVVVEDLDLTQVINIDQDCLLVYRLERRYHMCQPKGFISKGQEEKVSLLKKNSSIILNKWQENGIRSLMIS
jgi:hypothetical protein